MPADSRTKTRGDEDSAPGRGAAPFSSILLMLLCLVLIAAPLPLGANRPWAWTILQSVLFALLALWALCNLGGRTSVLPAPVRHVYMAMGLWLLYGALYLLPLPGPVAEWLSPTVHAAHHRVQELFATGADSAYVLTIDRGASLQALLKHAMYAAAFFLVTVLATSRARLKALLWAVLGAGVLQVALALSARAMGVDLTPRALMDGHWDVLRGTFVNRNHFGEFLAMTVAAGLGLSLAYIRSRPREGPTRWPIAGLWRRIEAPVFPAAGAVVLVAAGMIMSMSRGAVLALAAALVAVIALSVLTRGLRTREAMLAWPLGLASIGALTWSGSRNLLERFRGSGLVADERWVQWAGTRQLIEDYWLTGSGPGTYQYAFTAYKDPSLRPLLYDHAHNDYLQLLAEQGVIGVALLLMVLLLILRRLLGGFINRRDVVVRGVLFASLTGMAAMLIHSLVEFNFQIPANALYFWVLAGAGIAATRLERESRRFADQYHSHERGKTPV